MKTKRSALRCILLIVVVGSSVLLGLAQARLPVLPEVTLRISSPVPIGGFQATVKFDRRLVKQ